MKNSNSGFDQVKYIDDFKNAHYDRCTIFLPKGAKSFLRKYAEDNHIYNERGKVSLNAMIIEAIEQYYHIDLHKKEL